MGYIVRYINGKYKVGAFGPDGTWYNAPKQESPDHEGNYSATEAIALVNYLNGGTGEPRFRHH